MIRCFFVTFLFIDDLHRNIDKTLCFEITISFNHESDIMLNEVTHSLKQSWKIMHYTVDHIAANIQGGIGALK